MGSSIVRFPSSTGNDRSLTAGLWGKSLEQYVQADPEIGSFYFNDFLKPVSNTTDASAAEGWFIQDAAAGGTDESWLSTASPDGVVTLSATTGTDHFGIEAHRGATATTLGTVALPTHSTDARGRVIYETRVNLNDADSDTFFIGFTEPIVEFLSATSTLPTTSDYIGFYRSDAGAIQFVCANDNNGGTAVTDSVEVVADASVPTNEWVKLGFAVNPGPGGTATVDIYVNGVRKNTESASINYLALPIEYLTQKYAITRGATGDIANADLPIDWVGTFVGSAP